MNENEIKYVAIEIAKSGVQRKEFFEWSLNHQLYKVDKQTAFNSRMKAIYQGKCPTESLTAIIAIHNNQPIAMCLCENTDRSTKLYDQTNKNLKEKIPLNAKTQVVGFLSFFVKEKYRKKGIANKLMSFMELARMPVVLSQLSEEEYPLMIFEAREKAIDIIKKSKYSYQINCDRHHSSYKEKIDIFAKHAQAILTKNEKSLYYSNALIHTKKEKPSIEYFEKNYLKSIKNKDLLKMAPLNERKEENKIIRKVPTLKPRVLS